MPDSMRQGIEALRPRYARIPQEQAYVRVGEVPDEYLFTERPECWWGTGVYFIAQDGALQLVEERWDEMTAEEYQADWADLQIDFAQEDRAFGGES